MLEMYKFYVLEKLYAVMKMSRIWYLSANIFYVHEIFIYTKKIYISI